MARYSLLEAFYTNEFPRGDILNRRGEAMSWLAIPRVWAARELQERNDRMEQQTGPITATQLFEVHYDTVFRYISRRVFRREEAEDLAEEVFATAFGALARFRARCEPRLWLLSIARRKVIDWHRKRVRRREVLASELEEQADSTAFHAVPVPLEAGPQNRMEQAERTKILRSLIGQLKEEQREALLLHYADGLSHAEVAVVMGRSVAAVNSLLQRARAAIYREGRDYFGAVKEAVNHGTV